MHKAAANRFNATHDLVRALEGSHPAPSHPSTPAPSHPLGWWATHQLIVALCYWFMVWPTWHVHKWTGRFGVLTFLATLAIVIVGGNVRLHLWFTARTYPSELAPQLANIGALVRAADVAFSLLMIGIGLVLADAHTGWAALFVSFGLGAALGFLVIEPTTARAAFRAKSQISNLKSEI